METATDLDTGGPRARAIAWRPVLLLALLGTVLGTGLVALDLQRTRDVNGGLIHTGPDGPASALIAEDFPDEPQFTNGAHDGPMFYAVARDPFDLDKAAESLDRPPYRLQRPLFPLLAWALNPTRSAGEPLLWTMVGVGVLAMFAAAVATGALATSLGGPAWLALLVPVLPGVTMSLRITVADTLAVALLVAAIAASLRGRDLLAVGFAVLAVLAKEPMLLGLLGFAAWRADRRGLALVAAPVAVAASWYLYLRTQVQPSPEEVIEFGLPGQGLLGAVAHWASGQDPGAMLSVVAAFALAAVALLRRGLRHPLSLAIIVNAGFLLLVTRTVIGLERNGTRTSLPLLVLALVAVATPDAVRILSGAPAPPAADGIDADDEDRIDGAGGRTARGDAASGRRWWQRAGQARPSATTNR